MRRPKSSAGALAEEAVILGTDCYLVAPIAPKLDLTSTRLGLVPIIHAIRSTGAVTLRDMTEALNQRGIRSARGGQWHVSSVMNLFARARELQRESEVAV